jgi:hypothetical protein
MLIERKMDCPTTRIILGVTRFELNCFAELVPPANRLPPKVNIGEEERVGKYTLKK